jgi:hypothetical protein
MQGLLDYLAQHLQECPVSVLHDSQFQLSEGHVVSPTMTVTRDGDVYTADWEEDKGVVLLDKVGDAMEIRCGKGGNMQARYGPHDNWKHVIFHALSREVMEWLLQHSPPGHALCAEGEAMLGELAQLCTSGPLPRPSPSVLPISHVAGGEGVRGWTAAVVVVGVFILIGIIASVLLWRRKAVDNDVVRIWSPVAPAGIYNATAVPPAATATATAAAAATTTTAAAAAAAAAAAVEQPRWEDGPWINL